MAEAARRGQMFSMLLPPDILKRYRVIAESRHTTPTQLMRAVLIEAIEGEEERERQRVATRPVAI